MGCWDIYCFLCGNPARGIWDNYVKLILEDIIYYENSKDKTYIENNKNIINLYKKIYEFYKNDKKIINKFKKLNKTKFIVNFNKLNKTTKWMNKCTFLTTDNKIIHNCKEVSCNIDFTDSKKNIYTHDPFKISKSNILEPNGVFVHTDCWKYIKNKFNIKLNYSYLPIFSHSIKYTGNKIFNFINYGIIEKYWNQYFDFTNVIIDSNEYLLTSPLVENSLTSLYINKIFSKLKIRLDSERKGPITSAIFYNNGIYKIGLNGNFWQIKSGKWNEIKEPISKIIKIINRKNETLFIRQLKFIGEYNNIPLFVKSIKHEKQNNTFEFICIESYLPILNKKIK
jgi:hypothetical protein